MRAAWTAALHMAHARQIDAIPSFVRTAWNGWREVVLDPSYWLFLAGLSMLQLFWPAERDHRLPNRALAEDAMWFVFSTALVVTLLGACLAPLNLAYQHLAGGHGLNLTPRFGVWGVAILALLIADLLAWYSHWLHHHVPALWYFHAVHHSQTNLNVLSDNRTHFIETFVGAVVAYVPARILGLSSPDAIKLTSLTIFVSAVIHTNLRTNLGPLRNVFVSPQAHRVHHSISVEHFNTNYGTVFMFWDLLFRTRSDDVNVYPATGIDDDTFPHGQRANPASLLAMWAKQFAHPFRLALERNVWIRRQRQPTADPEGLAQRAHRRGHTDGVPSVDGPRRARATTGVYSSRSPSGPFETSKSPCLTARWTSRPHSSESPTRAQRSTNRSRPTDSNDVNSPTRSSCSDHEPLTAWSSRGLEPAA